VSLYRLSYPGPPLHVNKALCYINRSEFCCEQYSYHTALL
jgi:hypothetical protein